MPAMPSTMPHSDKHRAHGALPSKRGRQSAQAICSAPPMYGRSTSGTVIEPSAFW